MLNGREPSPTCRHSVSAAELPVEAVLLGRVGGGGHVGGAGLTGPVGGGGVAVGPVGAGGLRPP